MASRPRNQVGVPQPPRLTGDPTTDLVNMGQWNNDFYRVTVVESGLLDPSFQFAEPPTFDPNNLADPTNTSISRAQQAANAAYALATTANATADAAAAKAYLFAVPFTLTHPNNQVTLTFDAEREDTNYRVMVQAEDFTGSPGINAFLVVRIARATTGFTITFSAAPGSGNTVSFVAFVFPATT